MACTDPRYFHFNVAFYSDAAMTNFVMRISSQQYPSFFRVNGSPMTSDGAYICQLDCVQVEFVMPPVPPTELRTLFNRQLYAKIEKPIVSYKIFEGLGSFTKAQIIIVVDESGSMVTEHMWIGEMVRELDRLLEVKGLTNNDYGLVGFGGPNNGNPHLISFTVGGHESPLGNAEAVANFTDGGGLKLTGGVEDGYEGLNYALDAFEDVIDVDAALIFILITDEDRDTASDVTKDNLIQRLLTRGAILNSVVNCSFVDGNGVPALGVSSNKTAYIAGGDLYAESENGTAVEGSENTIEDYVDFTWQVGGITWDLNILREGGAAAELFSEAFVNVKSGEISEAYTCVIEDVDIPAVPFFCSRDEDDPTIELPITASNEEGNPIIPGCVHVRLNFYTDIGKNSLVYSAFSYYDQRRWYISNDPLCPLTPHGVNLIEARTVNVSYVPEVLPADYIENQAKYDMGEHMQESPLLCGVKYYVTADLYYAESGEFVRFAEYEYLFGCNAVKLDIWRKNEDAKNWLSSGQNKQDMRISRNSQTAMFPTVSANWGGQFLIAWQDFRNFDRELFGFSNNPQVYYGIWDTVKDIIWSSGTGNYDFRMFPQAFRPEATTDPSGTFYTTGRRGNNIASFAGPVPSPIEQETVSPYLLTDDRFFNLDITKRSAEKYLLARVYEEDQSRSFVLDKDKTVSVVEDCLVRIDIVGVPGVYAVRLRNENDSAWSDWINIDTDRPDDINNTDTTLKNEDNLISAYTIDDHRFLVPWFLSAGSGMKHVNIQVLTFYGISPTFGLDIMADVQELEYDVKFYSTFNSGVFSNELAVYNGYPVASASISTVYVKIEFRDKDKIDFYIDKLSTIDRFNDFGTLTFNVIQQGVNNLYMQPLSEVSKGIFKGEFVIDKSDGIYNKDGLAAVIVNIPSPCMKKYGVPCSSDSTDPYNNMNLSVLRDFYTKYDKQYESVTPENLMDLYRQSGLSRIITNRSLAQFYNTDDTRFTFGNPKFFLKKTN